MQTALRKLPASVVIQLASPFAYWGVGVAIGVRMSLWQASVMFSLPLAIAGVEGLYKRWRRSKLPTVPLADLGARITLPSEALTCARPLTEHEQREAMRRIREMHIQLMKLKEQRGLNHVDETVGNG